MLRGVHKRGADLVLRGENGLWSECADHGDDLQVARLSERLAGGAQRGGLVPDGALGRQLQLIFLSIRSRPKLRIGESEGARTAFVAKRLVDFDDVLVDRVRPDRLVVKL